MFRSFFVVLSRCFVFSGVLFLCACSIDDVPGLGPDPAVLKRQADAKAIGGACRYGLRGIEDCFALNSKASKADIFIGWKDMDQYMRDNKVDGSVAKIQPEMVEDISKEEH